MRLHLAPEPLLFLITTFLLAPRPTVANPNPPAPTLAGFAYDEILARWECPKPSHTCGYYGQLCCPSASSCYTNAKDQAECTRPASTWAGSAVPSVSAGVCNNECGDVCCKSSEYCYKSGTCKPVATTAKQTTTCTSDCSALPGIRSTSHSNAVVTRTQTPSSTIPYITPVATGANVTMITISSGSGLSGGAIAGIVVGVLVGLALLALVCFYCCLKGIFDGCLALFGFGRKRRVTKTEEYTRRTHYSSDGQKRTWYGTPKKTKKKEKDAGIGLLGVGAGLAALWAVLGLKRRREDRRRQEEKYSEYSYSSDYYTSESSASSDERRSERYSRHSVRRSDSRRP